MVFENDLNICVSTLKEVTGWCWGSGDKNVYCTVPQDFSSNNGRSEEFSLRVRPIAMGKKTEAGLPLCQLLPLGPELQLL